MLKTFAEYLKFTTPSLASAVVDTATNDVLVDGKVTQSQFSTSYTAWLTQEVFGNAAVQAWLKTQGIDLAGKTLTADLAQNSMTTLPSVSWVEGGVTKTIPQNILDALFTGKDTVTLINGKTTQDRTYVMGFESDALKAMFAPKQSEPGKADATEDGAKSTISALANVTDADNAVGSLSVTSPSSLPAGVSYDAATKSFVLDPTHAAFQSLAAGQQSVVTVNYSISDGTYASNASVAFTLTGVNDGATISETKTGALTEDDALTSASGKLTVADADTGEATFQPVATGLAQQYGSFSFAQDGAWSFDIDNAAAQSLRAGETVDQTLTVKSFDGTASETITVTLTGVNDGATISGTKAGVLTEDGSLTSVSGKLTVADVDTAEAKFQPVATGLAQQYGSFSFAQDGTWSFDIDNAAAQSLRAGETVDQTLTVKSFDGTASETITVTLTGVNDAPVIGGQVSGSVTEATPANAGVPTATGTLSITDADTGESVFQSASGASVNGYGTFSIGSDGAWSYLLDNSNSSVNALNTGQSLADTFKVFSADGTAQTISITINGATDAKQGPAVYTGGGDKHDVVPSGVTATSGSGNNTNQTVIGTSGDNNPLNGNSANDLIFGLAGNDDIKGNNGRDKLFGGSGNDKIDGGADGDLIIGGFGADTLAGGQGNDVFLFIDLKDSGDTISGFQQGQDLLAFGEKLGTGGQNAVTFADLVISQSNGNTIVSVDKYGDSATYGMQFTLAGFTGTLTAADFNFNYTYNYQYLA